MKVLFQPWQLLLLILAGWINRRQQDAIEYLLTENRVLLREAREESNPAQRPPAGGALAAKGKILGRKMLRPAGHHRDSGYVERN